MSTFREWYEAHWAELRARPGRWYAVQIAGCGVVVVDAASGEEFLAAALKLQADLHLLCVLPSGHIVVCGGDSTGTVPDAEGFLRSWVRTAERYALQEAPFLRLREARDRKAASLPNEDRDRWMAGEAERSVVLMHPQTENDWFAWLRGEAPAPGGLSWYPSVAHSDDVPIGEVVWAAFGQHNPVAAYRARLAREREEEAAAERRGE